MTTKKKIILVAVVISVTALIILAAVARYLPQIHLLQVIIVSIVVKKKKSISKEVKNLGHLLHLPLLHVQVLMNLIMIKAGFLGGILVIAMIQIMKVFHLILIEKDKIIIFIKYIYILLC